MTEKLRRGPGKWPRTHKDDAAELLRQERRAEALKLRVEGHELRDIGKRLGISHEQARKDIQRAIKDRGSDTREEMIAMASGALEAVMEGHVAKARSGERGSVMAGDVVVKAVLAHAKINGYEAPKQVELAGKDGGPIETKAVQDDLLSRIARLAAAAVAGTSEPKTDA